MIDNNLFLNEEINKIFESYTLNFHNHLSIKIDEKVQNVKLEDIFLLVDKDINNDINNAGTVYSVFHNLRLTDSKILNYEKVRLLFRVYFLSINCNLFEDIKNFDYVEQIFMIFNKYLSQIIDNDDVCIFVRHNKNLIGVSWTERAILNEKDIKFQNDLIYSNRCISNKINDGEIFCYSNSEFNEEQKKLINIYFSLSKKMYNYFFDRILVMNSLNNYAFGEKELEIDVKYYTTKRKLKFIGKYKNKINILHLSDMHITSNSDEYAARFLMNFKDTELYKLEEDKINIEQKKDIKEIDVIAVTGDIANAGTSSKEMLANYYMASKEIKKIAKSLLGNTWKERLLIVPGNHDYGMINELKINLHDRSYKSVDLSKDSTEFEKFIFFYLIFENELLNGKIENMSQLSHPKEVKYNIDNNTKISFYLFNTAFFANTIRSNKIRLKYDDNIINDTNDINILLMHHTPLLEINYYLDTCADLYEYKEFIYGCTQNEQNNICDKSNLLKEIDIKNNKIDKILCFLNSLIDDIEGSSESIILKNYIIKLQELIAENYEDKNSSQNNRTIKDIKQFENLNIVNDTNIKAIFKKIINENITKYNNIKEKNIILSKYLIDDDQILERDEVFQFEQKRIKSFFIESRDDKNRYRENFNNYIEKLGECIVLGGHYHKQKIKFFDNYIICEVGKTFDKGIYKFGILSVDVATKMKNFYSSIELIKQDDKYYSES